MKKFQFILGQKHHNLTLIEELKERSNGSVVWRCRCDCGRVVERLAQRVIHGRCKRCPDCRERSLVGLKFGMLRVVRKNNNTTSIRREWICLCECGKEFVRNTTQLKSSGVHSCGCYAYNAIELKDRQFGDLTVLERSSGRKFRNRLWLCECKCGRRTVSTAAQLLRGSKKSCGCSIHKVSTESRRWTGHCEISGRFWGSIKRSARVRDIPFLITIDQAWEKFKSQNGKCALSGIPLGFGSKGEQSVEKTASLDRIDSNLPYELSNIQWVYKDINRMKLNIPENEFVWLCMCITRDHLRRKIGTSRADLVDKYEAVGAFEFDEMSPEDQQRLSVKTINEWIPNFKPEDQVVSYPV